MKRSLNEVERICQKAAEGAGAPAGLDTDAARGAAWLVARDLPALADLARDLTRVADLGAACCFERDHVTDLNRRLVAGDKAGAVIAPMLIDLLVARAAEDRAPGALRVSGLTAPLFLLPPIVRYAAGGWRLRLSLAADDDRRAAFLAADGEARILGSGGREIAELFDGGCVWSLEALCSRDPGTMDSRDEHGLTVLRDAENLTAAAAESLAAGVAPNLEAWDRLSVLASKVLVPASEQSRLMGAGALASDNE
jgi:Protein of unknown function (DUF3726)